MTNGLEQQAPTPETEAPPEAPEKKVEEPSEITMLQGRKQDAEMRISTNEKGAKLDEKLANESSEKYPSFEPQYKQALQDILDKRQRTAEEIQAEIDELDMKIDAFVKAEEMKQLEEREHHELEYFNKEECLENIKNLESEIKEYKEKTQKLQKENDDSKSKYMHLQAEFENAQKRWNKTQQDLRTQYVASVLKNFLPLYDSFKKALDSADESEKHILNGFYTQFMNILKSYGAEPIKVEINDPFDYSIHEALTSIEKEDIPENSILEIVQDGWKYGKEVIRYTKVIVSRKPKPPEPEPEPEPELEAEIAEEEGEEAKIEEKQSEEDSEKKTEIKEEKPKEKKKKKHKKEKETENPD
ncbi:MAG: nucleotide exchange factor GrpE [Candidatus Thorarchaeota archaeon]